MTLDKFRETFVIWDKANRKVYEPLRVSGSDEKGRKLVVQVVNDGVIEDLTGTTLALAWETRSNVTGLDPFVAKKPKEGIFELFYTNRMLQNVGVLRGNFVLIDGTGRIVSEDFNITVFDKIDDSAAGSQAELSLLQRALSTVSGFDGRIERKADKIKTEQSLFSLNQQLAEKVGGQKKVKMEDLSSTVLGKLNSEGGPFSLLSIPQDDSVTVSKISNDILTETIGINLLDDTKSIQGGYYRATDGVWQVDTSWRSSPPIRVEPSSNYTKKSMGNHFVFLDGELNFLEGVDTKGADTVTVPANDEIKYMQYNLRNAFDTVGKVMIVKGSTYPSAFESYYSNVKLNNKIELKTDGEIDTIKEKIGGFVESPASDNLINPEKIQKGTYYYWADGSIKLDSSVTALGPIEIEKDTTYSKKTLSGQVTYWDKDMNFITGVDLLQSNTFKTPKNDNLYYIMLATFHDQIPVKDTMLVKGSTIPSVFVPFKPKQYIIPRDKYIIEEAKTFEEENKLKLYMTPNIKEFERVQNPVLTKDIVTDRTEVTGLADPFIVMEKGRYHCFFEVLNGKSPTTLKNTDEIGHAYSDNLIDWTYTKIVLSREEVDHRSAYPNVFKYEGDYYMLPDTVGDIRLYKATNFPLEWEVVTNLKKGVFVDTNVFEINGIWFMTTSQVIAGSGANDMTLYYNESGDWRNSSWVEHPLKHIIPQDGVERGKRNAGKFFHGGDYIIMPLQITPVYSGVYGEYTDWIKLSNLTKTTCTVTNLGRAMEKSGKNDWKHRAMHHISHVEHDNGFIYMVDGLNGSEYSLGLYQNT